MLGDIIWVRVLYKVYVKIVLVDEQVDAIVNPANSELKHKGGAAKAIAEAAGEEFHKECEDYINKYEELGVGEAMMTSAGGSLKCSNVIHAVGPDARGKNQMRMQTEKEQLRECVKNIIKIMKNKDLSSVSIPAISTGIFGFPLDLCPFIMTEAIKFMIDADPDAYKNKKIIMCNFDSKTTNKFKSYFFKEFERMESEDEESSKQESEYESEM